jgi:predicted MFS family arabinose efflux permease
VAGMAAIAFVLMGTAVSVMAVLLSHVVDEFKSSSTKASEAMSLFSLGMALASWPSGWTLDRIGPKWVMLSGIALASAGFLLGSASQTEQIFIIAVGLIGVGVGSTVAVPAVAIVTRWISTGRATALGILFCGSAAGTAIGPIFIEQLTDLASWRAIMRGLAGVAAALAPLVILTARFPGQSESEVDDPRDENLTKSTDASLINSEYLLLTLIMTLSGVAYAAMYFHITLYLKDSGLSSGHATLAFSGISIAGFVGFIFGGLLADSFGLKRMLIWSLMLAAGAVLILLALRAPTLIGYGVTAFVVVWGITSNQANQLTTALVSKAVSVRHFGTLMGISYFISAIVASLGAISVGAIKDRTGNYSLALSLCAVLMAVAGIAAMWLSREGERRQEFREGESTPSASTGLPAISITRDLDL